MSILRWLQYVVTPNVYPARWQDRIFRGHITIGRVTIYGANAMHWAVDVRLFGTYICFHPRTRTFGGDWPAYFYVSENATPWAARFILPKRRAID
jgi:hypothetical protein